jgi:broad specificity phosphatase PhoE
MQPDAGRTQRVLLLRHTETEWSRVGKYTGRTDKPLTEAGKRAAAQLRGKIGVGATPVDAVFVSPLRRARETHSALELSIPCQVRDDLLEWDYGDYEGLTPSDVRDLDPTWDLWTNGAPAGESPGDITARLDRFVTELRELRDEHRVLVVAHGHALRGLACRWIGQPIALGRHLRLGAGSVGELRWNRGVPVIERWNEEL